MEVELGDSQTSLDVMVSRSAIITTTITFHHLNWNPAVRNVAGSTPPLSACARSMPTFEMPFVTRCG
jgi:hypothetical protein